MPWEGPHSGPKIRTENRISDFQLTSLQDPTPLYPSPFALCLFLCTSSSSKPFSVLGVLALVVLLNGHWALWLVLYKLRKTILKWITSSYIRKKCSLALHNMTACSGWSPRLLCEWWRNVEFAITMFMRSLLFAKYCATGHPYADDTLCMVHHDVTLFGSFLCRTSIQNWDLRPSALLIMDHCEAFILVIIQRSPGYIESNDVYFHSVTPDRRSSL